MRGSWVAITLLASACGRFGFDEHDPDARPLADAAPFSPTRGGCTMAETGPFTQVANYPASVAGFGVWVSPPNILMADQGGGLHNLRFDGTTFTQTSRLANVGYAEAVWSDDRYTYLGSPGNGFRVVEIDAAGTMTVLATKGGQLAEARRGWAHDGTVFVPAGDGGLHALRFDGTAITDVGMALPTMQWSQGALADDAYVYLADNVAFRVLAWNGTAFTDVVTPDQSESTYVRIWKDRTTLFVSHDEGVSAYRMNGTTLQKITTFNPNAWVRDVWSDGVHVFIAANENGVYALTFENDAFTEVGHIATGGNAVGVFGDGELVYANDDKTGLHAYRGFSCLAHD